MFRLITGLLIAVSCSRSTDGNPYQSQDLGVHPGGSCISAMRPVMDYVVANQMRWNTCEEIIANHTRAEHNEIRTQLAALQEAVTTEKVSHESRLESNVDRIIPKMEGQQKSLEAKLDSLEGMLTTLQNSINNQFAALQLALSKLSTSLEPKPLKIPQDFEQFGTRYFYIQHSGHLSWTDAEIACRRKFGRLASFQNEEELTAISAKLMKGTFYWTGINDLAKKGDFMSLASGNRATFLKWSPGEPNYGSESVHCVAIINALMSVEDCNKASSRSFICQSDETV